MQTATTAKHHWAYAWNAEANRVTLCRCKRGDTSLFVSRAQTDQRVKKTGQTYSAQPRSAVITALRTTFPGCTINEVSLWSDHVEHHG